MRVATVIDSLGLGGAERLLVTLARTAPQVDLDVTVMTLRDTHSTVVEDGIAAAGAGVIHVATTWRHQLVDPRRLLRLAGELRRANVDVVHTHLGTANVLGVVAARRLSLPVVGTLHNVRLGERGLRVRAQDVALRHADAIVAVGHEVARTHATALAPRPITVVPNPVDPQLLAPTRAAAVRGELARGRAGPILLDIARLEPQKGHVVLLEALRSVVDHWPDVVLALAGEGSLEGALAARVAELGLDENVRLLGPRRDVPDLLAAADLFVSASHYEGMPLSILEAMAAGLPVVATAVGDVPTLVDGAGVLVPPNEPASLAAAIDAIVGDPARRRALGASGAQLVSHRYDALRWAEQLRAVYERVGAGAREGIL
jgi:glycosyltransferase involved in cell wall biosynthesis